MDQLDLLYRAFLEYRKNTMEDPASLKLRRAAMRASADKDKVEARRSRCTIEEDWVIAIEEGLPYVEKAIMEERQFIRQEGGVEPIEKVRHVSKDSVAHLAKHGNLITRKPENPGDDLVPDKLYIVEKLTNYAVYENRFLYMLLCYLRDFIDLRYHKIMELGNTYKADMTMTKSISIGKRTIKYDTHFFEEARDDPYSKIDQKLGSMIDRIKIMQNTISILLNTPLMREVSTAPMLKPPITRTNALRMDNALRQSLALYDYVASYQKDGYTVEVIKKTYNPFPESMGDEFSELIVLASFLVYEYGNNIKGSLKEAYDAEEKRREAAAAERFKRKIEDLKYRVGKDGHTMEEYMLLLEERNRYLEPFVGKLAQAENKIHELEDEIVSLKEDVNRLNHVRENLLMQISRLEQEMIEMMERHKQEILELKAKHEAEMQELRDAYELKIQEMEERHAEEMAAQKAAYEKELADMAAAHAEELRALEEAHARELAEQKAMFDAECQRLTELHQKKMAEKEEELRMMMAAHEAHLAQKDEELQRVREDHAAHLAQKEEEFRRQIDAREATISDKDEKFKAMSDSYNTLISEQNDRLKIMKDDCNSLTKRNQDLKSQLHALRHIQGYQGDEEDYSSEERYEELLSELVALDHLIGQEWKKAKKKIRHDYLWRKPEKSDEIQPK